ncbi:hypothetical protein TELCIR_25626, partial [Teladorsagia circumcincta]
VPLLFDGNLNCGDFSREEGKYKNNVLVVSSRRKGMLFVRSSKLKERVEAAIETANRAASIAQQKVCRRFSVVLCSGLMN